MAKSLEIRKAKALEALLSNRSLSAAAKQAQVSRKTLYSYLHNDTDFAEAYSNIRKEILHTVTQRMNSAVISATEFLVLAVESPNAPIALKMQAGCKLLDFYLRLQEIECKTCAKLNTINSH